MLLTIRTTHQPATDLGFLLHKHPDHVHTREFPFGKMKPFLVRKVAAKVAQEHSDTVRQVVINPATRQAQTHQLSV